MPGTSHNLADKVALVTGSAKRLGAASVQALHAAGANVVVHYHESKSEAEQLVGGLNALRPDSAISVGTKLGTQSQAVQCVEQSIQQWGRLDILVNNASSFYPTPMRSIGDADVAELFGSNVSAPLFVSQAAQEALSDRQGSIVNMVDIHGFRPYENYMVYCAAKAALVMLTRSMAIELAPHVRVNGVAPGAILWPEDGSVNGDEQLEKTAQIPMRQQGSPQDIASAVLYLCSDAAHYITGEIIKVDGGRSL